MPLLHPLHYQELDKKSSAPAQSLRLRPDMPPQIFFQFLSNDAQELIAVHSLRPYGDRTEESVQHTSPDLFKGVFTGDDYSLYEVEEDVLTLKAISLGTGSQHVDVLRPVYQDLGKLLVHTSERVGLPLLHLGDFALRRSNGQLLFIPPVIFSDVHATPIETIADALSSSIHDDLLRAFGSIRTDTLSQSLMDGIYE